ncbi:MAG: hypothetical protein K2X47_03975 [Bdellovibrionales bacterium]|nr:hypothetical protein [Bdellovibrionales bacterium]
MSDTNKTIVNTGDEVVRAAGELSATAKCAAKGVMEVEPDHDEGKSWLTTIFKAIIAALK